MINFGRKEWRSFRPPPSASINLSHPLANGLVLAILFNEGVGMSRINRRGILLPWTTYTGPGWGGNDHGTGFAFDGSSTTIELATADVPITAYPFTIAARYSSDVTYGTGPTHCAIRNASNKYFGFRLTDSATNHPGLVVRNTASTYDDGTRTFTPKVSLSQVGVFASNTDRRNYVNGIADGVITNDIGFIAGAFRVSYVGTVYFDGIYNYVYLYNRSLTADEAMWLHVEPYCFYVPLIRKSYFIESAPETITMDKWYRETSLPRERTPEVVSY